MTNFITATEIYMKKLAVVIAVIGILASCGNGQHAEVQRLQAQVDSLRDNSYRPGLGEFMMGIQVHHAKLWFAGEAQNWELANFEMAEIKETMDGIKQYCADRPEVKLLKLIDPAMDSVNAAITQKNEQQFKSSYLLLTNTCNDCHHATQHAFNVIKVPDTPPYSNQVFSTQ
jgi:hypothetical protein